MACASLSLKAKLETKAAEPLLFQKDIHPIPTQNKNLNKIPKNKMREDY